MARQEHTRGSIFLFEFVMMLLVFFLLSTVTLQLFAKTRLLSQRAGDANGAVLAAQSLSQRLSLWDGRDSEALPGLLGAVQGETPYDYECYYDADWQPADKASAVYLARVTVSVQAQPYGTLVEAQAQVLRGTEIVYTLPSTWFHGKGGDA